MVTVFTAEQQEILSTLFRCMNTLLGHVSRVSTTTTVGLTAVRSVLVEKAILTEEEWDAAVGEVEHGQASLFSLDPDVQAALSEIRRVYPWFLQGEGWEAL